MITECQINFDFPSTTLKKELVSEQYGPQGMSLVLMFVERMYRIVQDLLPVWTQGINPDHSISYDTSRDFHRVFSFLQFSFCCGSSYISDYTCRQVFGDSVHWAGTLFLCLSRQAEYFLAVDFTYHLGYVAKLEERNPPSNSGSGSNSTIKSPTSPSSMSKGLPSPSDKNIPITDFLAQGEYFKALGITIMNYYAAVIGHDSYWNREVSVMVPPPAPEVVRRALLPNA
jgi:cytoplasmic FMR1 interacting protein